MTADKASNVYALGSTDAEHQRLIRQAAWLAEHTERLFREAGIGTGQRVLDLGSGVGDVSLIAARLVGPSGEVLGIERDARSIARAKARMSEAGFHQVSFTETDANQLPQDKPFDAVVGRYILMFLPDPLAILRSLVRMVRPGGVVAFQEPSWGTFHSECKHLPLWGESAALLRETFRRSGTNTEMGPQLSQLFQDAGLPAPSTREDRLIGAERWMPDCVISLRPQMELYKLDARKLGDLETLFERLLAEAKSANRPAPLPALISAWSRK